MDDPKRRIVSNEYHGTFIGPESSKTRKHLYLYDRTEHIEIKLKIRVRDVRIYILLEFITV